MLTPVIIKPNITARDYVYIACILFAVCLKCQLPCTQVWKAAAVIDEFELHIGLKREAPLSQGSWLLIYCLHRSVLRCSNDLAIFDVFEILDGDGVDVDHVLRLNFLSGLSFGVHICYLQRFDRNREVLE